MTSDNPPGESRLHAEQSPTEVLDLLLQGNARFQSGTLSHYDHRALINSTANGQAPSAVLLSCIDSRVPVEQVFDVTIGDVFSARVAGNVIGTKSLASIEYAVGVAQVRLLVVLGHTRCGAATAAVEAVIKGSTPPEASECIHLSSIIDEFKPLVDKNLLSDFEQYDQPKKLAVVDDIARKNVLGTCESLRTRSPILSRLAQEGELKICGAMYDVASGKVELL